MTTVKAIAAALALAMVATSAGAQDVKLPPPVWSTKPDLAQFEAMENADLAAAQKSIDQLVAATGTRTIDNTLVPLDHAVQEIDTANNLANLMQNLHPDAAFRDKASELVRKASAAQTDLSLNVGVYKALAALNLANADPATRYYVQHQLLEFKLAGVDKDDATRTQLKKLNDQLTESSNMWERNIADGQKTVEVASASDLDGLPQDYIDAHKPGPDGKIKITTNYPDIFPALRYAKSDELRRKLWVAFNSRAYPKNNDVLAQMMQSRYKIATLLGYKSWADYYAADKMAGNGKNIENFIQELSTAAHPATERELAMLLTAEQKINPQAKEVSDYQQSFLNESVRRSNYQFNSESVRVYFPYDQVKKGILDTASKLFHVSFQQETGAVAWDRSVETYDVFDSGKIIGRIYLDMHPRPGKYAHDATAPIYDAVRGKQLPEGALMCNFPAATATDPGLMDYGDVTTFFHEFGHLMHHLLAQQQWAGLGAFSVEQDFVEAPSQMLEEWIHSPQVLATFAKNYKTGEPIPAELVARMNRASAFGRASDVTEQIMFAAISYDMYKSNPEDVDPAAVTMSDMRRFASPVNVSPETSTMYASFDHLAGYSSAYYTYMWDLVIAQDFFQQFNQKDLLAGDTAMRYRHTVLEPGASMPATDLVKNFLGRPQNMDALKKWMGQEFATPSAPANVKVQ
jgi:thimet oligopeptidase